MAEFIQINEEREERDAERYRNGKQRKEREIKIKNGKDLVKTKNLIR